MTQNNWKLIYYHEDGRNELYHLAADAAETTDVSASHASRTKKMRATLDQWLKDTQAKFPAPDPMFDAEQRKRRWTSLQTSGKASLEKRHAVYLDQNYRPNKDWWGSEPLD
jgi:hypothetical protein